jgi:hypothetical protein
MAASNPQLLVFSPHITPRVRYIFKLILQELLGLQFELTSDKTIAQETTLPLLNYSEWEFDKGIRIKPAGLLFHKEIFEQEVFCCDYEGHVSFFAIGEKTCLPFDPFSAAFFLVSRYEEYLPHIADEHGRFVHTNSISYQRKVLKKPMVNIWAEAIADKLHNHYPALKFTRPQFAFIASIDVDNAYAFRGKGLFRSIGAIGKDLIKLDFKTLALRLGAILGLKKDPYDTFPYQLQLQQQFGFKSIYFMLFSKFSSHDRNLSPHSHLYQRYIKGVNDHAVVGLHPSYRSHRDPAILEEEHRFLEGVINQKVFKSRQHYLKMSLPHTLRNLIDLGITEDYSMGYAAEAGFRAGICTPFNFYDLEMEIERPLRIFPLVLMDVTYIDYQKMTPEKAWEEIRGLIDVVRQYGGTFVPVWHNRTFSEAEIAWKGWNNIYEKMVAYACRTSN